MRADDPHGVGSSGATIVIQARLAAIESLLPTDTLGRAGYSELRSAAPEDQGGG
jgi:hypothetical protein